MIRRGEQIRYVPVMKFLDDFEWCPPYDDVLLAKDT
jgi:hypothetical protein